MTNTTDNASEWMTVKEAAAYLGCSRSFLNFHRYTEKVLLPYSRLGRRIRYRKSDLDAFLEKNTVKEIGDKN